MTVDIQQLLRGVENGTRDEIWEAAKELESVVLDVVQALTRLLRTGTTADTRAAAAYVLGFGRFASARTSLEAALENCDEDALVRGHAAEALAYIQSRDSVDILVKHVEDNDPGVKYWCTFALGQIGDAKALPSLKQLAEHIGNQMYEQHSLRAEALDAIAAINNWTSSDQNRQGTE